MADWFPADPHLQLVSELKLICVGHKLPLFQVPQPFRMLAPVPLPMRNVELIPDDFWGEEYDGRVLSEFLQLFVMAERLDTSDDEPIYLFQYRKFILPSSAQFDGRRDRSGGLTCRSDEASRIFPSTEILASAKGPITGRLVHLDVAQQFSTGHFASDFASFCMAMHDSGLFPSAEVAAFIRGQSVIWSATLGVFSTSMLVRHLDIMCKVWEVYRSRYYVPREGRQTRVGGYLLERLHSFLILRDKPDVEQWERVVVVP